MVTPTRVWAVGRFVLLAAALAATYLLSAWLATRVALRAREVRVPSVVDQPVSVANATLSGAGLALRVDESRRADPKIAPGRVARQEPPPGSVARRGRSVRVWVSAGDPVPTVPRLTGEGERAAQLRLQQAGLAVQQVSEIRSNEFPPDTVVAQDPPERAQGASVSLLVNRGYGAAGYVMPDLIGVDGYRAADILRGAGFRVAVVEQTPYPGVPPGVVLRQGPQGGFKVSAGDTISLEVSR